MTPAVRGLSPLPMALVFIAAAGLLSGVMVICLAEPPPGTNAWWGVWIPVLSVWAFMFAGLVAWWRRPANHTGLLIVAGGGALLAGWLPRRSAFLEGAALVMATVVFAVAVHLLHAFPSGRLHGTVSRVTVAVGYFVCTVLQAPVYVFGDIPGNPLQIVDRPDLAEIGYWVQTGVGTAVMVVTSTLLVRRLRRATPLQRRILAPVYGYGMFAVLFIPLAPRILPMWNVTFTELAATQMLILAGIPLAFALGLLSGGFVRTRDVEELGAWLSNSTDARLRLTPVLARTLGDESLEMLFWDNDRGRYELPFGMPALLPSPGTDRAFVEFDVEGDRVGAIVYDSTLIADPQPVRAAGRVAAIALAHERLTAELRVREEEIRRSRLRIVEAADRERRRIARNLHDGLQVRLVLLAMNAQQAADDPAIPERSRQASTSLRAGIDEAAAELRVLVHEVMPAALIERGLSAATADLVDRLPLKTHLELGIADVTLAPPIESTAYFVIAEALTNALKHSRASRVGIRLIQRDGRLEVEVFDDGRGGAIASGGSGLRGLVDRVDTLGGAIHLESPEGLGTRLRVELPCGP